MRLFDLHCDTLYECYTTKQNLLSNRLQLDLLRGLWNREGWVQAFAVWMPDTLRGREAYEQCLRILAFARQQAQLYNEQMLLVQSPEDIRRALASRRCAAILTVEGGSALAGRLEALDTLASAGVKAIAITWNGENELGCGSGSGKDDGLTALGKKAVRRMEELGILPDVSHLNEHGFWDVLEHTDGPVIASHSLSAAVHPHPRNLSDAQFTALVQRGGLVGLNLCAEHLGGQSFERLERHLARYLSLGGERAVAFGCDLDGTSLPPEWEGIAVIDRIYDGLLRKNYKEKFLDRLFFGNCYDFFTEH